jgi:hypothetical protein
MTLLTDLTGPSLLHRLLLWVSRPSFWMVELLKPAPARPLKCPWCASQDHLAPACPAHAQRGDGTLTSRTDRRYDY